MLPCVYLSVLLFSNHLLSFCVVRLVTSIHQNPYRGSGSSRPCPVCCSSRSLLRRNRPWACHIRYWCLPLPKWALYTATEWWTASFPTARIAHHLISGFRRFCRFRRQFKAFLSWFICTLCLSWQSSLSIFLLALSSLLILSSLSIQSNQKDRV